MRFDTRGIEEEALLEKGVRFEDVLRHARARVELDVEEEAAALSTRPTMPVFHGEPWR